MHLHGFEELLKRRLILQVVAFIYGFAPSGSIVCQSFWSASVDKDDIVSENASSSRIERRFVS